MKIKAEVLRKRRAFLNETKPKEKKKRKKRKKNTDSLSFNQMSPKPETVL